MKIAEIIEIKRRFKHFLENAELNLWKDFDQSKFVLMDVPTMIAELSKEARIELKENSLIMSFEEFTDLKEFAEWWEKYGTEEFAKARGKAPLKVHIECH